jgi:hypothetical protein
MDTIIDPSKCHIEECEGHMETLVENTFSIRLKDNNYENHYYNSSE